MTSTLKPQKVIKINYFWGESGSPLTCSRTRTCSPCMAPCSPLRPPTEGQPGKCGCRTQCRSGRRRCSETGRGGRIFSNRFEVIYLIVGGNYLGYVRQVVEKLWEARVGPANQSNNIKITFGESYIFTWYLTVALPRTRYMVVAATDAAIAV